MKNFRNLSRKTAQFLIIPTIFAISFSANTENFSGIEGENLNFYNVYCSTCRTARQAHIEAGVEGATRNLPFGTTIFVTWVKDGVVQCSKYAYTSGGTEAQGACD